MAIYAVGDLHGCFRTWQALEKKIGITPADTVICCGDLVDRGPDIKGVLDYFLNRPNTKIVLGNHDFCFIDFFKPGGMGRNSFMLPQGLQKTIEQLGIDKCYEYAELLSKFPFLLKEDSGNYVFCHADYNWAKDEDEFIADSSMGHLWTRIDKYSHQHYKGPIIVHGHTPCQLDKAKEINPDTGEIFGVNLDGGAAYDLPWACLRVLRLDDGAIFEQLSLDNAFAEVNKIK